MIVPVQHCAMLEDEVATSAHAVDSGSARVCTVALTTMLHILGSHKGHAYMRLLFLALDAVVCMHFVFMQFLVEARVTLTFSKWISMNTAHTVTKEVR